MHHVIARSATCVGLFGLISAVCRFDHRVTLRSGEAEQIRSPTPNRPSVSGAGKTVPLQASKDSSRSPVRSLRKELRPCIS